MAKAKMKKLHEVGTYPFVFQNKDFLNPGLSDYQGNAIDLKGKWNDLVFKKKQPITVELACGKADYTIVLADKFPQKNFVGVDIKGDRLWRGAKNVEALGLQNVAFLRTKIEQLDLFFDTAEIDEMWITFPDPFPKKGDINKRLSYASFLAMYKQVLKPHARFHFKTDALALFDYTVESVKEAGWHILREERDIYGKNLADEITSIKTYYEIMHLADNRTINYLQAEVK